MHFDGGINRPPYEMADGFLQVTRGCSHNRCLFCTYFKDAEFSKSPIDEIQRVPALFQTVKFIEGHHPRDASPKKPKRILLYGL